MSKIIGQQIIEIDGWKVYDLPIPYTEKDYEEAREELIAEARNSPDLVALFEYGYIPYFGISDMDFWAVFSDDADKMCLINQPPLSEKTQHVMSHEATVITEKHYKKMIYFDPWTINIWPDGHRLLYKKEGINRDLNFEKINFSYEEKGVLSLIRLEGFMASIYSAIPLYAKKELPIRDIFENIKSCIYMLREINNITGKKIDSTFPEDLKELMSNWFNLERKEAIRKTIKLFHDGLFITFEMAFSLSDWLKKRSQLMDSGYLGIKKLPLSVKNKSIYLNNFGERVVFSDIVKTSEQAFKLSVDSYKRFNFSLGLRSRQIDFFITFQPFELSAILLGFASEEGLLSDNLKGEIFSNQKVVPIFKPKIYQDRIKMINEITEIYNRKMDEKGNGKGWLFGNNRYGYSFERQKIRRKLLTFWLRHKFWRTINKYH